MGWLRFYKDSIRLLQGLRAAHSGLEIWSSGGFELGWPF